MAVKKVTIRQIAERAGVATSTVSHSLNGTAPISEKVRNKVLDAARELGYLERRRAKGAISALRSVLLAVPDDALPSSDVNYVSWTILNALKHEAETRGLRLIPFALRDGEPLDGILVAAEEHSVDGIIVMNDDRDALLNRIRQSNTPTVLINGEDPEMYVDSVTPGNRFAAGKAVRHLRALGHKKIMHLTWHGRKTIARRLDGFRDAMTDASTAPVLFADSFTPEDGARAIRDWLRDHSDRDGVTAIFCAADNLAFGAMAALKDHGLSVPGDISVMGFDGVAPGEFHDPQLATVAVPLDEFGRAAITLLENRVIRNDQSHQARPAHRLELGCEILERSSISAPGNAE